MLKLSNIRKSYAVGDSVVDALRGVDLEFRENEFVSILGPSGCGKTTMLNLIGGLDRYSSGDLIINGRSTKEYTDKDWDTYRNHSVGFVFQSYNLIPHQTVLSNVELALTLSGVSKGERRRRAREALEKVGLGDQLTKKPNQMSGGQMQRVAIARALINDPDILLADEPTGALDSETSLQVMALLKEVAKDRLVVMVTHNPELAEAYSTRIVKLKDGVVTDDSDPYHAETDAPALTGKQARAGKRTSMSFPTAFGLSMNNLMTKKGRTFLTSFAGSIGIIGIALILSLSTGINSYIDQVQQETLSSYPVTIQAESVDMSSMMTSFMGIRQEAVGESGAPREEDRVYSSTVMFDMVDAMFNAETEKNNLKAFKEYLDAGSGGIAELATIRYGYDMDFDIYTQDVNGKIVKSDVMTLLQDGMSTMYGGDYSSYFSTMGAMYEGFDVWEELLPGENGALIGEQVLSQHDLLYGKWPESYDEVVLFVTSRNEISDLMLYALGFISSEEMSQTLLDMMEGKEVEVDQRSWGYDELCGMTFKLILPAECWQKDAAAGTWVDMSATAAGMDYLYNSSGVGTTLRIVGIARPSGDGSPMGMSGAIGYTSALTAYAIDETEKMDVIREQMDAPDTDVLLGLPFATGDEEEPSDEEKQADIIEFLRALSNQDKANAYLDIISQASAEYVSGLVDQQMDGMDRPSIEEMIVERYASEMGVDGSTVMGYISEMSDEQLFSQVREAMASMIREQYGESVRQRMGSMSVDQLAQMLELAFEAAAADADQPEPQPDAVIPDAGQAADTPQFPAGMEGLPADAGQMAGMDPTAAGQMTGMPAAGQQIAPAPFEAWQFNYLYDNYMPPTLSDSTYEDNLDKLGYVDKTSPATISFYAATFADKDKIAELITQYNDSVEDEEDEITYTDYVALLMSSITGIISGISYLLIAFVSISLIVSSIMIGIITYISVLERTKEIGILRAVGASKRDISRVFNAETLIVGLGAGIIGIGVTLLLTIPINAILYRLTDIAGLKAILPPAGAVVLILISVLLTTVAGLIPSRLAARKDPVEALRTE